MQLQPELQLQMPAPAASCAAAPAADATKQPSKPAIQHPFDPSTTACLPDLRTLCQLPANPDEDGVHTLRAMLLPKGKTVHVPDEPGCYATVGPARTQTALCLVHFTPATKRSDELLLTFVDYGMLSSSMTGMYVQTLMLPLQKSRNIYEETPRFTPIKDVCGFSNINAKAQPWCAVLKPALERQALFQELQVFKGLDVPDLVKTSLVFRLKKVHEYASAQIETLVQDLARQDKKAAEKMKAKYDSSLAAALKFFHDLGPKRYDRPLKNRILMLGDPEGPPMEWLTTPDHQSMRAGHAKLESTARRAVQFGNCDEGGPADKTASQVPEVLPAIVEEADEANEFPELSDEVEGSDEAGEKSAEAPSRGSKRARVATTRFEAAPATKRPRKTAKGKDGKKVSSAITHLWLHAIHC